MKKHPAYTPNLKRVAAGIFVLILYVGLGLAFGKYNEIYALELVKTSELNLSGLKVEQGQQFRKLYGEITNNSPDFIINTVGFKIIYKNCQERVNKQDCSKIGEESSLIMKTVLPGETIEFETILSSDHPINKFTLMERHVDFVIASKG